MRFFQVNKAPLLTLGRGALDRAEIALMEEYERTRFRPDYYSRPPFPLFSELDPRLCPRPWRRGDGGCATR